MFISEIGFKILSSIYSRQSVWYYKEKNILLSHVIKSIKKTLQHKNKINRLTMGQLVNVSLTIDNEHTTLQKILNCRPGYGDLNQVYRPNCPTFSSLSICSILTRCTIMNLQDILLMPKQVGSLNIEITWRLKTGNQIERFKKWGGGVAKFC